MNRLAIAVDNNKKGYKKPTIEQVNLSDANVGTLSCWQCDISPSQCGGCHSQKGSQDKKEGN